MTIFLHHRPSSPCTSDSLSTTFTSLSLTILWYSRRIHHQHHLDQATTLPQHNNAIPIVEEASRELCKTPPLEISSSTLTMQIQCYQTSQSTGCNNQSKSISPRALPPRTCRKLRFTQMRSSSYITHGPCEHQLEPPPKIWEYLATHGLHSLLRALILVSMPNCSSSSLD